VKALRLVQLVLLIAVVAYLVMMHNANPTNLILPFMLPLPPVAVIVVALIGGWLVGWLPGRLTLWRKKREVRGLQKRVAELEQHVPRYEQGDDKNDTPVIPDRDRTWPTEAHPSAETR
jgi:uncharacterized integral membrane protein